MLIYGLFLKINVLIGAGSGCFGISWTSESELSADTFLFSVVMSSSILMIYLREFVRLN